jgi:hypothetical protein
MMLEEFSVETTQEAPFHTVGRSSEQRGTIVSRGRKDTGVSLSREVRSIASFWPTIRWRKSSFPASNQVCAVSSCSFKWPILLARSILTPSCVQTLEFLTFVPSTRRSKNRTAPTRRRGRWASGVLPDRDPSQDAKPALYDPKSARRAECRLVSTSFWDCAAQEMRYFKCSLRFQAGELGKHEHALQPARALPRHECTVFSAMVSGIGPCLGSLLDRPPSLQPFRRPLQILVRSLRRYYAVVGLPSRVQEGLIAPRVLPPARCFYAAGCSLRRWDSPLCSAAHWFLSGTRYFECQASMSAGGTGQMSR